MKWPKYILIVLALLLAIAAVLPFFISLNDYIPRIEKEASARLKEPVSIKSIRFAILPLPHFAIEGIKIGTTDDISVGKVRVTPALFSLLKSTRVIRNIEIDSLTLTQQAIDKIPAWAKELSAQPRQVRVERINFNMVQVNLGKTRLGPFDARVNLDGKGESRDVSITSRDGKLKALIKPGQSNYLIDASAKAWTLPVGPAIVFDELIVKGVATLHDADLSQVSARLYGGTANGKVTVSWQKGMLFKGNLDINQMEMQKIAAIMLPSKNHISGKLRAKPVLFASAASADQLMNALRLETPFNVQSGVIHGVDIQKVATGLIKPGSTGGETHFEHLSGYLVMAHRDYHFTQLQISSGSFTVDGNMSISPKKELSGRINAQIKAVGASTSVPLNIAGTLDAPLLYPTAGTLAGAAVGTAILGPGVGTSVGAKVGGWLEGLFGGDEEKKPTK